MDGGIGRLANWTQLQPREAGGGAVLELRETPGAGKEDHGGDVGSPLPLLPQAGRKACRDCEHPDSACMCVYARVYVCKCMHVSACMCVNACMYVCARV